MERKITKKDRFNQLLAMESVQANEDLVAFIQHEIELLVKKSAKAGTTKTQKENEVLMEQLYADLLEIGQVVTITEFQKVSEVASTLSNQKISALFKIMIESKGTVEKSIVKGKTYFKAVVVE
jgi:tRNA A37 methylthiotransferase MiaB